MKAIICVGVSASGKTTFAREWKNHKTEYLKRVIVCRDDVRFRNLGFHNWNDYKFNKHNEQRVTDICNEQIRVAAIVKNDIIIADTNLNPITRNNMIKKLEALGYEIEIKEFPITLEEAWKRDSLRENGVGHATIYKQWQQWLAYLSETARHKFYIPDTSKPKAFLCDLDGTVFHNDGKRSPFDWDKVSGDRADEFVWNIVNGLSAQGYKPIFMSGRDSVCRNDTYHHIDYCFAGFDIQLFMRKEGDMRKDTIVKSELFWNHVADNYNVVAAIDDRGQVCRLWHDLNIKVINVGVPWIEF